MKKILGVIILMLPFNAILVAMVREIGWKNAVRIIGAILAMVGCFVVGKVLLGD